MANARVHAGDRSETREHAGSDDLRDSPMMAHLLDALKAGEDIGEYGRLTFAMVARYFLPEEELIGLLAGQPGMSDVEARAMLAQLKERKYNPPKRERVLEWQALQEFPICLTPEDPNACNVYRELRFPDEVYEQIDEFWLEKSRTEA